MKRIFAVLLLVLLYSCGGNKGDRPLQDYVSSFIKENKNIVLFGKADINTLLNKSEYESIPKFGVAVKKEMDAFRKSLNTETPVYFALEGPFQEDGTPSTTFAFFEVVNADSLVGKITQQGFDFEKMGDIQFFQSGDVAFGVKGNLAMLISKGGEFNGKKLIGDGFDKVTEDVSGGKVDEILASKGDVVLGMNMRTLYETSNTDLKDLNEQKRKEILEMVDDSYIRTTLSFEAGAAILESKNLFSTKLMDRMFFKEDASGGVVGKLGMGSPKLGVAMNLDMKKLQSFLDDYSPQTMRSFGEMMGGPAAFIIASGGKDALAGLLSGEMGAVMVGEPNKMEGLSDFNFYLGLGQKGKMMADQSKGMLEMMFEHLEVSAKGIKASSNKMYASSGGQKINLPKGCENFGKKGVTAFVSLEGVDLSAFEFENEQKIIYLVSYVTFEMDNNGSKLYIKAKEGKANLLKQAVDVVIKELSGKIGNMTV